MATITLKNVPDNLLRKLKQRAAQHRRSLNNEVIVCLESVIQNRPMDVDRLLERVRRIRKVPRKTLTDKTLKVLKEKGRP
ncbi:MAG: hypothetical protein D6690_07860 [Nitrospirae bacterium]|nr:MAG: hypothetical protein D6690_07860 [Nitrospirota bacterium]